MCKPLSLHFLPLLFFLLFNPSSANVGTAAYYGPPYLPTTCFGGDASQFPALGLFAATGEGIWDNDASCGRQYLVRCLSSAMPKACINTNQTIQVKIVDRASMLHSMPSRNGTTLTLSTAAFKMIADTSAGLINIEFVQV